MKPRLYDSFFPDHLLHYEFLTYQVLLALLLGDLLNRSEFYCYAINEAFDAPLKTEQKEGKGGNVKVIL